MTASFDTAFSATIPPPDERRPPLRAGAFAAGQFANCTLAPLFPYVHRGAIVPTVTLFMGGTDYGHFFHRNTEEEVALVIAERGGLKTTGSVMIAPLLHGVQCFLREPDDPESFLLITITQRQPDETLQTEHILFRCGCNEVLFEYEFDASAAAADAADPAVLLTLQGSAEGARAFNADVAQRTCKRCGKVADPFPLANWGWLQHAEKFRAAQRGRSILAAAATARPDAP